MTDPSNLSKNTILLDTLEDHISFNQVPKLFDTWMPFNGRTLKILPNRRWLCLTVRSIHSFAIYCANRDIPFFVPYIRDENNNLIPLWLDYFFCCPTQKEEYKIKQISYIRRCLIPSDEEELLSHLKILSPINELAPEANYSIGDNVKIRDGMLSGTIGRIIDIKNNILEVDVEMLGTRVSIVKNFYEIIPISNDLHIQPVNWKLASDKSNDDINNTEEEFNIEIAAINSELFEYLSEHPNLIHTLSDRKFEQLVAEILSDMGYEVHLTPRSRDKGRDILAVFKLPHGDVLTIVECKKYRPDRKIGVEIIERFLWTIIQKDRASCGLIATTSFFTSGAKALEKTINGS